MSGVSRLSSLAHAASGTANDVTFGYSYNPASQITGRTVSNAAYKWGVAADFSDSYADNSLNQITTLDTASFMHDARGNTTNDTTKTYAYDADNRMTTAGTGAVAYDPAGRLYRLGSGTETRFLYAGASIIAEYNQSNALQRRFVHAGLDEPLVWLEGTGTSNRKWHLGDERGSVIAHANATAAVTDINRYDPFGVPDAANSGRFRYAGAPWIASAGLYHMRARDYSPATGRFMQADPIGYSGGMNLYGYVGNDPVNFTDPFGLATGCVDVITPDGDVIRLGCDPDRNFGFHFNFGGFAGGAFAGDRLSLALSEDAIDVPQPQLCLAPPAPAGATVTGNITFIVDQIVGAQTARINADRYSSGPGASFAALEGIKTGVFIQNFRTGGPMDFKQSSTPFTSYAPFGNYNYGAVGTALGYSPDTLLRAAGLVQTATDIGLALQGLDPIGQGSPLGGSPYGDDPKDQADIQRGIADFLGGCF